jgi:hypothetical protein
MNKSRVLVVGAGGGAALAASIAAHLRAGGMIVIDDPRPTLPDPASLQIPTLPRLRREPPKSYGPKRYGRTW